MEITRRVQEMIVQQLRLTLDPTELKEDAPLFGPEGMGLDSVDALELVLGMEQHFGVEIPDEEVGRRVLQSVRTMSDFVRQRQAGAA